MLEKLCFCADCDHDRSIKKTKKIRHFVRTAIIFAVLIKRTMIMVTIL